MALSIQEKPDGLVFTVHVQPRSSRNKIVGVQHNALKLMLTAPPLKNAANKACCEFLAKQLKIKKAAVSILSGHTARRKRVMVQCEKDDTKRKSIRDSVLAWVNPNASDC